MQTKTIVLALAFSLPLRFCLAADENGAAKPTAVEKTFIMKAARGGVAEVEAGKMAAEKGGSDAVKDFGNRMVKDHSKVNEQLKEVASKMGVKVSDKLDAKHQAKISKMTKLSGAAFDKAYVKDMVQDHQKDVAEFEKADKQVKNADLKKFIEDTIPVMKEHLDMIQKFDQAKQ